MKNIFFYCGAGLLCVLLVACGGHGGGISLDEAKDDGIPFLEAMGVDVRPLVTDEQLNLWSTNPDSVPKPNVRLSDSLAVRLLKALPETGVGQDTAQVYIVGVRPLQQGNVLVAFVLKLGRDQRVELVTYNEAGTVVDAIDVGVANGPTRNGMWNYPDEERLFSDSIACRVVDGNELMLTRVSSCIDAGDTTGMAEPRWRMERNYVYSILQDGSLELTQAKIVKLRGSLGDDDPSIAAFDMMDLLRYPHSGHGLMPKLDFQATKPANRGSRDFTAVVYQLYWRNPLPFLTWLGNNPGNHVEAVFKPLVDKGVVPRDQLMHDIERVKSPEARRQLQERLGSAGVQQDGALAAL